MNAIPTIDIIQTGVNIDMLRRKAGISVRDLRDLLGLSSTQAIYKWTSGHSVPSLDTLVGMAAIFGVHIDDIIALN